MTNNHKPKIGDLYSCVDSTHSFFIVLFIKKYEYEDNRRIIEIEAYYPNDKSIGSLLSFEDEFQKYCKFVS